MNPGSRQLTANEESRETLSGVPGHQLWCRTAGLRPASGSNREGRSRGEWGMMARSICLAIPVARSSNIEELYWRPS